MSNKELLSEYIARMTLERRRKKESERQKRFCDERLRTIGVDKEALDRQVREKKMREECLKEQDDGFVANMMHYNKMGIILENREKKKRRSIEQDLNKYREMCQQPQVEEMNELDGQMLIPGLLGEDPESESREKLKKEQLRVWLLQQQADQAARKHRQMLQEQCDENWRTEMFNKAVALDDYTMKKRKEEAVALINCNLAMAEEKRRQEAENKEEDGIPSLCMNTVLEPPQVSLEEAIQCQKRQIEERQQKMLREKEEEDCFNRIRLDAARRGLLLERKQKRMDRQQRREMDCINAQLARTEKLDLSKGAIDERFFSQFDNCSR